MNTEMNVILASGSPRRRELLFREGISFTVEVSHEEETVTSTDPEKVVLELSHEKACSVFRKHPEDCLVIGADTVVSYGGRILGKPLDESDAFRMIQAFQGKHHQVYTGVSLQMRKQGIVTERNFAVCSEVLVKPMTDDEIRSYLSVGESMDKAGAYAIQGAFSKYISEFSGDYDNIVGLPVTRVVSEMQELLKE